MYYLFYVIIYVLSVLCDNICIICFMKVYTLGTFSAILFTGATTFFDCLFGFQLINLLLKKTCPTRNKFFPKRSKFFLLENTLFQKRHNNSDRVVSPESISPPLKECYTDHMALHKMFFPTKKYWCFLISSWKHMLWVLKGFYLPLSTVFTSYQGDEGLIMKAPVQPITVQS